MKKTLKLEQLDHIGSLVTLKDTGTCLGYLLTHDGKSFDAYYGLVPLTPQQAEVHNKLLDTAMVEGLAKCPIGKCGLFYFDAKTFMVKTWLGTVISNTPHRVGKRVTFRYLGMIFVGETRKDDSSVIFKRVS